MANILLHDAPRNPSLIVKNIEFLSPAIHETAW